MAFKMQVQTAAVWGFMEQMQLCGVLGAGAGF